MDVHLFATDPSAVALTEALPPADQITALIVPENRIDTEKVRILVKASPWTCYLHQRGKALPGDLPPATVGISWLYSQIISPSDLRRYSPGILNMHGGKIPEYRGASVLIWAIINGEKELGITWHQMEAEVDSGPIWHETTIPIPADITASVMRESMIK